MHQDHLKISPTSKAHIAIMSKSLGLLQKIVSGEKSIESRWYLQKTEPWDNIFPNDTIYFKNAGEPIELQANVKDVVQFSNLDRSQIESILKKYSVELGIAGKEQEYFERFKDKHFAILIFLDKITNITPFKINKSGFGSMTAWITVDDIEKIKIPIEAKQNKLL